MQNFKFSYDKKNDDLFLYNPKSKSKGSVEIGDMIFDFNSRKELVGMQFINATRQITNSLKREDKALVKSVLSSLKSARVEVKPRNKWLFIKFLLIGSKQELPIIPISVPHITEQSPALAY